MTSNNKSIISYSFIGLFIASCSSVQVTEEAVYEDSIQSIEVSSKELNRQLLQSLRLFLLMQQYILNLIVLISPQDQYKP